MARRGYGNLSSEAENSLKQRWPRGEHPGESHRFCFPQHVMSCSNKDAVTPGNGFDLRQQRLCIEREIISNPHLCIGIPFLKAATLTLGKPDVD